MNTIVTVLLFIAAAIGVPSCIAFWKGLNLDKSSAQCESERKDISTNILMTKLIPSILTILILASLILLQIEI